MSDTEAAQQFGQRGIADHQPGFRRREHLFGGERDHAAAATAGGRTRQAGGAKHGATEDGDVAAGIFVTLRLAPWQAPQPGAVAPGVGRDLEQERGGQADIAKLHFPA